MQNHSSAPLDTLNNQPGLSRPTVLPPIGPLFDVGQTPSGLLPTISPHLNLQFSPPLLGTKSNADEHQQQHDSIGLTGGRREYMGRRQATADVTDGPLQTASVQQVGPHRGTGAQAAMADEGVSGAETGMGSKRPPPPLDTMRAYRACLNCRGRKSKCDLDVNQGRPPCRRCQREARECILGESHRGGRRVRKKPKLEGGQEGSKASGPSNENQQSPQDDSLYSPRATETPVPIQPFQAHFDNQQELGGQGYTWRQPTPTTTTRSTSDAEAASSSKPSEHTPHASVGTPYSQRHSSTANKPVIERSGLRDSIAAVDLQNPSDALEILAQVADRAEDVDSAGEQLHGVEDRPAKHVRTSSARTNSYRPGRDDYFHYKPCQDGLITPETIDQLFTTYETNFHPFFPIAPRQTFNKSRLSWLSRTEPHLFSAILTVASKDNEQVHHICYNHMQNMVSLIMAGSDADLEAVEALLLLSQWVSNRPQNSVTVGRGEEDRVAWMYIGTALRLGYFLGIDRSSFKPDSREDPLLYKRKRLTWTACYMLDRQVSVRVGKGFWSRGPGPLSGLKGTDFPNLVDQSTGGDNWGMIFQANLELTQIFSNVHDILYASKGHGWKEMLEGRYAKYLDDFRLSIRNWNDVWGSMVCSPRLKASLLLTYNYLRLYVNAFAYQATISRALTFQRDSQNSATRQTVPLINATATDARFIYEALDAAKSLLSTFTTLVEPETLRYMPSSYYLFIIYSAVFLYKARSTTTMTDEERTGVRRMINQTIDRLQKASNGPGHMGSRYARLLQMLWRKAPKSSASTQKQNRQPTSISERLAAQQAQSQYPASSVSPISGYHPPPPQQMQQQYSPQPSSLASHHQLGIPSPELTYPPQPQANGSAAFSWLDLGATWNFATQNNSGSNSGSLGEMDLEDDHVMWDTGLSPFNMGLLTDYSVLEGDNPNLIF